MVYGVKSLSILFRDTGTVWVSRCQLPHIHRCWDARIRSN